MEDITDLDDFFAKDTPVVMRRSDPSPAAEPMQNRRSAFNSNRREEDYGKEKNFSQQKMGRILFMCLLGMMVLGMLSGSFSSSSSYVREAESDEHLSDMEDEHVEEDQEANTTHNATTDTEATTSERGIEKEEKEKEKQGKGREGGTQSRGDSGTGMQEAASQNGCQLCNRTVAGFSYDYKFDPALYPAMALLTPKQLSGAAIWTWSEACPLSAELRNNGVWQVTATEIVRRAALQASVVKTAYPNFRPVLLDVGAGLGWFSLAWAGVGGHAISVESSERSFYALANSVESNDNLQVLIKPVLGSCVLSSGMDNTKDESIWQPEQGASTEAPPTCVIPGSLINIDATFVRLREVAGPKWFSKPEGLPITMMKLDSAGWKAQVLQGAKDLLEQPSRKPCAIFVEGLFEPESETAKTDRGRTKNPVFEKTTPQTVCEDLMEFGYNVFLIMPDAHKMAKSGNDTAAAVAQHILPMRCGQESTMRSGLVALWPGNSRDRAECAAMASWKGETILPKLLSKASAALSSSQEQKELKAVKVTQPCCHS
eukprot:gnl/MRDRNA2_/MRDRNA2_104658_c0_seq1.p1 gnl/MRDRNA2_/MRDRNA2_104658_c0~~gnl/MRDRNA2_/MRDRNA2_104658_c0_seq1.p1  ORF type:complete len:542 (+),score=101.85 gnl/MRDRNA2_/MRDRNA2_104658_c0_seq1:82-1707(+)